MLANYDLFADRRLCASCFGGTPSLLGSRVTGRVSKDGGGPARQADLPLFLRAELPHVGGRHRGALQWGLDKKCREKVVQEL